MERCGGRERSHSHFQSMRENQQQGGLGDVHEILRYLLSIG